VGVPQWLYTKLGVLSGVQHEGGVCQGVGHVEALRLLKCSLLVFGPLPHLSLLGEMMKGLGTTCEK